MLLTGIYFNLEISLLDGPYYYPAFTQQDYGHRGVKGLAQGLTADRICAPSGPRSQNIHIYSTVQEMGRLPAQGSNPDSSPGPQHKEDTHSAFFTTVGTDHRVK